MNRFLYWSIYGGGLLLSALLIVASFMAVFGVVPLRSAPPILAAGYDRASLTARDAGSGAPEEPRADDAESIDGWDSIWEAQSRSDGAEREPAVPSDEAAVRDLVPVERSGEAVRTAHHGRSTAPAAAPRRPRRDRPAATIQITPDNDPPSPARDRQAGVRPEADTPLVVAGLWQQPEPETQPDAPPETPADPAQDDDGGSDEGESGGDSPGKEQPRGPLRLSLVPGHAEVSPGDIVSVRVVLSEADRISSVPFHVRFNNEILEYVGAQSGPAITGSPVQPILLAAVNPARPDDLAVGLALVRSSGRFSGSGTVVVLDFRALQAGQSDLLLESASVRDTNSRPLTVQLENAALSVR